MNWWHKLIHPYKKDPNIEKSDYTYDNQQIQLYGVSYHLGKGFTCYDGSVRYDIIQTVKIRENINRTTWPIFGPYRFNINYEKQNTISEEILIDLNSLEGKFQDACINRPASVFIYYKEEQAKIANDHLSSISARLSKLEEKISNIHCTCQAVIEEEIEKVDDIPTENITKHANNFHKSQHNIVENTISKDQNNGYKRW
tara:strand:- start:3682 stop:4278 length:597 start_codon:yes stop_codon:yes gene_type:complete